MPVSVFVRPTELHLPSGEGSVQDSLSGSAAICVVIAAQSGVGVSCKVWAGVPVIVAACVAVGVVVETRASKGNSELSSFDEESGVTVGATVVCFKAGELQAALEHASRSTDM